MYVYQQEDIPHVQYLSDSFNVQGVRLLMKTRFGYLWLMKSIVKAVADGAVNPICRMCNYNVVEDVEHFLLSYPALEVYREQLHRVQAMVCSSYTWSSWS